MKVTRPLCKVNNAATVRVIPPVAKDIAAVYDFGKSHL
jgi:hypothetical protein